MNRRKFVQYSSILAGAGMVRPSQLISSISTRAIKVGIIGVGLRGRSLLSILAKREDTRIAALCDIDSEALSTAQKLLQDHNQPKAQEYTGDDESYRLLLNEDLDAVIIATPWRWHAPMAKEAMLAGKYVGCEVPVALSLADAHELVRISEETGRPCMMLENVCYRRDVMAVLNMVREGLFGELLHMECGYQHDLRHVKFNDGQSPYGKGVKFGDEGYSESKWRTIHSLHKNADLYPTHGIGPVAQMLDINRGNRFLSISSFATKSRGLNKYIEDVGGKDHPHADLEWRLGDIVTSMLTTENGETVILKHDTNSPRPYSLGFRVQGTEGLWMVDNESIYIEGMSPSHQWESAEAYMEKYDHPLWKKYETEAEGSGHGGMDFFVIHEFIEAVKGGRETPIDVYDSVTWSAIVPLSEQSIATGSQPIPFPDFTGGAWVVRKP